MILELLFIGLMIVIVAVVLENMSLEVLIGSLISAAIGICIIYILFMLIPDVIVYTLSILLGIFIALAAIGNF